MDQRTRMFRVLVCLAVSMTAGSVLLAWLEPAPRVPAHVATTEECQESARLAVASCPAPSIRHDWDAVLLSPIESGTDRLTLAAVRYQSPVHFVVGRSGEIAADPSWRDQVSTSGVREIRIGLRGSANAEVVSSAQRAAVLALLDALNRVVPRSESGGGLPVHLSQEMEGAAVARAFRGVIDSRHPVRG